MAEIKLPDDMPRNIFYGLPRDDVGRPVPFFVEYIDGKPDFRIMNSRNMRRAIVENLCWVCGRRLTRGTGTFVAGPMCVINRTSAEPPSHYDCARWSARACPFLTKPAKERRETNMPADMAEPPGVMIARNPGCTALIVSTKWSHFRPPIGQGLLWRFNIERVEWMAEGRGAALDEVWTSVETGISALVDMADKQDAEEGGRAARYALAQQVNDSLIEWFPDQPTNEGMRAYPNIIRALTPQFAD